MRSKRRNTNLLILQSQLQNLEVKEQEETKLPLNQVKLQIQAKPIVISGGASGDTIIEKVKKKRGIPKDELINTKRLLTM